MKIYKFFLLLILPALLFVSCSQDEDDVIDDDVTTNPENLDIENYLYDAMSIYYVYEADVPELGMDYFEDQDEKNEWLSSFDSPEDLFYEGLVVPAPKDRFSFITDDYRELENRQDGISTATGMDYGLATYGDNGVLAFVRYVISDTPAEEAGVKRGMMFTDIDGERMTVDNYRELLNRESFEIDLVEIIDNTITDTDESIALTREEITENPVHLSTVIDFEGTKVGYLVYNAFTDDFDGELNDAFAELKSENIDELVLDLRYNGGGNVESAVDLASMITGQFSGEIFSKNQYNELLMNSEDDQEYFIDRFNNEIRTGDAINSLNLNKVYIIGTGSTASASELVMNGLAPYIDVIHVGTSTVGKFQAAAPLYDSPNFGRQNRNPDHRYVIQPLIYEAQNANDDAYYEEGLIPDIEAEEDITNLIPFGDAEENLLAAALADISGNRMPQVISPSDKFQKFGEINEDAIDYQRMYIDELPAELLKKARELKK